MKMQNDRIAFVDIEMAIAIVGCFEISIDEAILYRYRANFKNEAKGNVRQCVRDDVMQSRSLVDRQHPDFGGHGMTGQNRSIRCHRRTSRYKSASNLRDLNLWA